MNKQFLCQFVCDILNTYRYIYIVPFHNVYSVHFVCIFFFFCFFADESLNYVLISQLATSHYLFFSLFYMLVALIQIFM